MKNAGDRVLRENKVNSFKIQEMAAGKYIMHNLNNITT